MRVENIPAYILHSRPFKDTSAILDCFTSQYGLVSLVARGVRRPRASTYALAQPFIFLQIGWVGRGDLKTLTQIEAAQLNPRLIGQKILLGMYLNEVLIRLLLRMDPHPQLFQEYDDTINAIAVTKNGFALQVILRQFELKLLAELGYGLNLSGDVKSGQPISADLLYSYDPNVGIFEASSTPPALQPVVVSGAAIIALCTGEFSTETELREAKKLMRFVLAHYLGDKPLKSRQLFQTHKLHEEITHEPTELQ